MGDILARGMPRVTYCFSKSSGVMSATDFFSARTAFANAGTPVVSLGGDIGVVVVVAASPSSALAAFPPLPISSSFYQGAHNFLLFLSLPPSFTCRRRYARGVMISTKGLHGTPSHRGQCIILSCRTRRRLGCAVAPLIRRRLCV